MANYTIKTKILNIFRSVFKISIFENLIVRTTQGKKLNNFFVKLLPANYQYPKGSFRKVFRQGSWFNLDISDYMDYIIYYGIDSENREPLERIITNNITILDIGVNIGETLLLFANKNNQGKVYGFEPVPYLYERAKVNISLNKYENIILNNMALSDKEEELYFDLPTNFNSGGINMHKIQPSSNAQIVIASTIDNYIEKNGITKVDLIKIDVEGFEMNVLKGGMETINKHKPKMFIEISENNLISKNSSSKEIMTFLSGIGYNLLNTYTNTKINPNDDFTNCHFDLYCSI